MLVASKESIEQVRRYKSPWFAATIVLTIVYFFGVGMFLMSVSQNEFRLAEPTVLKSGQNIFESDTDTVYLLVKVSERNDCTIRDLPQPRDGRLNTFYKEFDKKARDFEVACAALRDSHAPKLFWMTKSEPISGVQYDTRVFAAFFMTKGQRMSINVKWQPDAGQKKQHLAIVRFGVRIPEFYPYYDYAAIKSGKFLSSGHVLSDDDLMVKSTDPISPRSPLDLPLPLIGDCTQLKLKTRLLAGERIKSSMLQLPTSEAELARFLHARNLAVTFTGPNMR